MPDSTTTNLDLVKPEIGGSANSWGGKLNANFDTIDAELLAKAGGTLTGKIILNESDTAAASLNIPSGVAPTTPVNGDIWSTTTQLLMRISGVSRVIAYLTDVLQVSNNLSDIASAATARTNLGVTATGVDTTYNYRANNLSDVANSGTARTNLDVPSRAGSGASGTWGISISGNAATATTATSATSASSATSATTASTANALNAGNNYQMNGLGVGTASIGGGHVVASGHLLAYGNVIAYYSDDRLKKRLGNVEAALEKICSLKGFYYEANETAQALGYEAVRSVGISAQDLQKVLPEAVHPAPVDSQYLTADYARVVPLLIEAIKELSADLEMLKK